MHNYDPVLIAEVVNKSITALGSIAMHLIVVVLAVLSFYNSKRLDRHGSTLNTLLLNTPSPVSVIPNTIPATITNVSVSEESTDAKDYDGDRGISQEAASGS